MWSSTVGLINGKHRYLTAETFGFKINSNGQALKKRQQWTIEPFPENLGPDGSVSSAASVSSQCPSQQLQQPIEPLDPNDTCILTFSSGPIGSSLTSIKSSSNGSSTSDQDVCGEEHENVALKSHLNKYLAVDSFGNVTCDSEEKTENARFTITICSMSQGRSKDEHIFWAFRNVERGYYLGTTEDGMICCNSKMPRSRAELWHLHLIPARGASFFALKSLGRKRFARVVEDESKFEYSRHQVQERNVGKAQVQLDATISWGSETLFQFKYHEGGRYSLLTSDCLYLTNEGKCVDWKAPDESALPPAECLFTLEYHSGFLAFRDSFSHYLAAAGRSSILRSRSIGVSRDELFVFESSPIQISLKATFNNRWVSIKQGVDLSANQTEVSSKFEVFQMTHHKQTQNWSIMTYDSNFWTVLPNTNTVSVCKPGDYEALNRGQFKLIWSDSDATCSLKFVDSSRQERWIAARKSGQLFLASGTQSGVKFIMRFQNRKLLNLRPIEGNGFVGLKTLANNCKQLEANKTTPDSIAIEYCELVSSSTETNGISNCLAEVRPSLPEIAAKPIYEPVGQQTINVFNVRLNSTKMGQSVLDRFNTTRQPQEQQESQAKFEETNADSSKESDFGIDGNNNCTSSSDDLEKKTNGSVESSSAPSVASIISSFSNAKLSNGNNSQMEEQAPSRNREQTAQASRASSTVLKLASSFETQQQSRNQQQLAQEAGSDTASIITSCSTASAASSSAQSSGTGSSAACELLATARASTVDQLAQFECCYLKTISNDRYLVVGDNDTSVTCDATNKACAQPWILELRGHNAIAIRASDNHAYMQLGTNGTISLSRCDPREASLWEF